MYTISALVKAKMEYGRFFIYSGFYNQKNRKGSRNANPIMRPRNR